MNKIKKGSWIVLIGLILVVIIESLIRGFVFMKIYEWFFAGVNNLPNIDMTFSTGIMVMIGYLKYEVPDEKKEITLDMIIKALISPIFFLFYAYLLQLVLK